VLWGWRLVSGIPGSIPLMSVWEDSVPRHARIPTRKCATAVASLLVFVCVLGAVANAGAIGCDQKTETLVDVLC
jgi:hypothetical protein